ncbi:hypothetical protein ACHHYP_20860 [Achlya hypogyna]|uniref:Uncharacterized protein n=1 Tax=Achlya hypogyna TaxID=1202772 RepID=A0A1V9Y4U1_ACHHY|nr:hypothetical protein ACHHYP_20860 [Achlya hypogyna]
MALLPQLIQALGDFVKYKGAEGAAHHVETQVNDFQADEASESDEDIDSDEDQDVDICLDDGTGGSNSSYLEANKDSDYDSKAQEDSDCLGDYVESRENDADGDADDDADMDVADDDDEDNTDDEAADDADMEGRDQNSFTWGDDDEELEPKKHRDSIAYVYKMDVVLYYEAHGIGPTAERYLVGLTGTHLESKKKLIYTWASPKP